MRTRAQQRSDAYNQNKPKSSSKTKKQILQEKKVKQAEASGKAEGKKKIKRDPSVDQEPPPKQPTRKSAASKKSALKSPKTPEKQVNALVRRNSLRNKSTIDAGTKKDSPKKDSPKKLSPAQEEVKKRKKSQKPAKEVTKQSDNNEEPAAQIKKIQFKGKVPIDQRCRFANDANYHVLQNGGKVYSATLNQTSVQNNNNKFYIIQLIQNGANAQQVYFYTRWGRVGVPGQLALDGPYNLPTAIGFYNKKFNEKHNQGNYREVQLNYQNQDEEKDKKDANPKPDNQNQKKKTFQQSKLSKPVKKLIQLIFDLNMMNKQMVQIGYNVSKMPLGKLSKDNIKKGYGILQKLMDEIKNKKPRAVLIQQFTNDFYSFIPHDFGFAKMHNFILDTEVKVKKKIEMLQALAQIKIATNLLSNTEQDQNKIDSNYKKLNRDIEEISPKSQLFQIINKYLQTTHASTHSSYSLELQDLFELKSQAEQIRYTKEIDNKTLLWHGSRLTNFVGILSQGLRIAPPQAPATGYMFGKGVYFADMSSKSANYCFTSRESNTGILLLCQTALGNMNEKLHADYYASNLPPGKHSTKGVGRTAPNPKNAVTLSDGVIVPMGPGENINIPGGHLMYNEFIVYDIAQIKIRYLLRTRFNYKQTGFGGW